MNFKKDITILVPCFNEEKTIVPIMQICNQFACTVCIDDGSTDNTLKVLADARILAYRYVRCTENRGKTFAIHAGLEAVETDLVMLLDGDLQGLEISNLENLYQFYKSGIYQQCVASIKVGYGMQSETDGLWGQRIGKTSLWRHVCESTDGYAFEKIANKIAPDIGVLFWPNVSHRSKLQKFGFFEGMKRQAKMFGEIFDAKP